MSPETKSFFDAVTNLTGCPVRNYSEVIQVISQLKENRRHSKQLDTLRQLDEQKKTGVTTTDETLPLRPIPEGYAVYKGALKPRTFLPGAMIWHPGREEWHSPVNGGAYAIWGQNDYLIIPTRIN